MDQITEPWFLDRLGRTRAGRGFGAAVLGVMLVFSSGCSVLDAIGDGPSIGENHDAAVEDAAVIDAAAVDAAVIDAAVIDAAVIDAAAVDAADAKQTDAGGADANVPLPDAGVDAGAPDAGPQIDAGCMPGVFGASRFGQACFQ